MSTSTHFDSILEALAHTPETLERAAHGLTSAELRWRPAPGEFSLVEHACHLRDLEIEGYAVRLRRLRDEDSPELEGFDGTRIASERDYLAQPFVDAVGAFRAARRENLHLVAALAPNRHTRMGRFGGKTDVTIPDILAMMREHDGEHVDQLRELLGALERARCPH